MAEELDNAIRENAQAPSEVSVDGQSVKGQRVSEQIAADRYLASKAAVKKPGRGLRFSKLIPPGA